MAKIDNPSLKISKIGIILIITLIILLVGVLGTYVYMSKLNKEVKSLTDTLASLSSEKQNAQNELDTILSNFDNFNNVIKVYSSYSEVMVTDTVAIATASLSVAQAAKDNADGLVLLYAATYNKEFSSFKLHANMSRNQLENNKDIFREVGIDPDVEINKIEKQMGSYEDFNKILAKTSKEIMERTNMTVSVY